MQKTGKASNHGSRVVAKKLWKSRSKSQSRTSLSSACVWTPQGSCQWVNIQSRVVTLCDTTLLQLTEMEAAAVQQVALQRLADFNLGCTVRIPKDFNVTAGHKPKRRPYLLKKRPLTTGFFDTAKRDEKGNNNNAQGLVFGIPLKTCMENDRRLRGRGGSPLRDRLDEPLSRKSSHGGSHASFSSLMDAIRDKTSGSCESLNIMEKRSSVQDSSLSLASDGGGAGAEAALQPHVPQVPQLVTACIRHIETHGLHTVGIFRVSSSKKRARQLREEFDSGADVKLSDDLCPHDVATLIKEYFRDLPEPLLPHDLYQPFLASQKIRNRKQQFDCLQHLIQLLAVPNRDTLWALLCFLKKVADCAADRRTPAGEWLTGNRMDSNNLATLFAPNILHSLAQLGNELSQQATERIDVINVIRSLIDHNKELFEVSAELLHEAYQLLMDKQPEALDVLLRRRLTSPGDEVDLELDTSSSVFECSEGGSQPATATDRERTRDGGDELRRRKREPAPQEPTVSKPTAERSRRFRRRQEADTGRERSRRRDKSGSREDLAGGGGGGGWFRRRVRSSSSTRQASEEQRSSEERPATSRWFRRRDKSSSQASDSGSEPRGRRGSLQAADRPLLMRPTPRQRSSSDQTVAAPAPQLTGRCERRLSSPELDVSGVITASLTIPAPASTGALSSTGAGDDIPYIEECQTVSGLDDVFLAERDSAPVLDSRQRHRSSSSDSHCSEQPITGSLSIQPLARSVSGQVGERGFVITAGGEPARPQLKVVRSPSADSTGSVGSEGGPPAAAPRRRVRPPPADHVTLGQLVLPSGGGGEMARSRTSPNISQHTVVAAPAPVRRVRPQTAAAAESPPAEPRVRRRAAEAEAPPRRTRRPAGRSVTANVYELKKSESASPTVWKRRQLIASDTQTGV
ncbi:uncharacterized protein LOC122378590 [Amphibalanus amphitrite]|uniref:uncharacterized protein LOC122378590 n=1 Tax=Amphibalanus amphitrite TaxID=1232801 RepID=UPI001C9039D3|nr:uncharacterized protein LOC122378590 [Amphibalanus amphitrite]